MGSSIHTTVGHWVKEKLQLHGTCKIQFFSASSKTTAEVHIKSAQSPTQFDLVKQFQAYPADVRPVASKGELITVILERLLTSETHQLPSFDASLRTRPAVHPAQSGHSCSSRNARRQNSPSNSTQMESSNTQGLLVCSIVASELCMFFFR